ISGGSSVKVAGTRGKVTAELRRQRTKCRLSFWKVNCTSFGYFIVLIDNSRYTPLRSIGHKSGPLTVFGRPPSRTEKQWPTLGRRRARVTRIIRSAYQTFETTLYQTEEERFLYDGYDKRDIDCWSGAGWSDASERTHATWH